MGKNLGEWLNLCTPKGRIVVGPMYELQKFSWEDGVKTSLPEDKWRYRFGLAIPKSDPGTRPMLVKLYNHVLSIYSANEAAVRNGVVEAIKKGFVKRSGFSWKIYDGDIPSSITGQKPKNSTGCYVLPFDIPEYIRGAPARFNTYDWRNQPIDWTEIRLGYECDVAFSVIDNGIVTSTPGGRSAGIYLNAQYVRYLGTGEEITLTPAIDELMPPAPAPAMGFPAHEQDAQDQQAEFAQGPGIQNGASASTETASHTEASLFPGFDQQA
jgi:hypothetical protein